VSCEHKSPRIELREQQTIIVCRTCRTELVGWSLAVTVPTFITERFEGKQEMQGPSQGRHEQPHLEP